MEWIGWSLWNAALRDEGEVDVLQTAEELIGTGRIQRCPRDGILSQAVDGDCSAPLTGGAARAGDKLIPNPFLCGRIKENVCGRE